MIPGGRELKGKVAEALQSTFGSIDVAKEKFNNTARTHFGAGWAWLVVDEKKKLQIYSTKNQDSPAHERTYAYSRVRCLGACILSKIPEPTRRLY